MRAGERGFTLVWALASLALMSIGLSVVGPAWSDRTRRDREDELLRVGRAYAQAIASYHRASPGSVKQYPRTLEDLLEDRRFVGTLRHLRRLYPDPLRPERPWGLVRGPDGGIRGVYVQSQETPWRREGKDLGLLVLPPAQRYEQWQFIPKVDT